MRFFPDIRILKWLITIRNLNEGKYKSDEKLIYIFKKPMIVCQL